MDYAGTLSGIAHFTEQTFIKSGRFLPYHNLEHTRNVVDAARQIGEHYQLNDADSFTVQASAWFHDLGFTNGPSHDHELRSVQIAESWLKEHKVEPEMIHKIRNCILSTRLPQNPANLAEKVLADADLWNLGTDFFTEQQKRLKKELEQESGNEIDTEQWRKETLDFLYTHRYFTEYAQYLLQPKKEENIERIREKLQRQLPEADKKKKKKAKDNPEKPTRGIETMFRVTIHNHLELSSMADSKANIMISVNSIIVSVVLSVLLRRLEEYPNMIIPTIILLAVNITTIVCSILAVRPKILRNKVPDVEMSNKKANLLFFGNFSSMSLDTYTLRMKEMMQEKDYLYENMINNIYFMGIVLGRKYHWLRMAYNVFMYGFIMAVLAFGIAAFS